MNHDQRMQKCRDEMDAIRAAWAAAKAENPQLVESIGKPVPNWSGTGEPPLITDGYCSQYWLVTTGRKQTWEDAIRFLEVHKHPLQVAWSEERKKGAKA
jgi:hypothetical protein